jgi:hypothetical protein
MNLDFMRFSILFFLSVAFLTSCNSSGSGSAESTNGANGIPGESTFAFKVSGTLTTAGGDPILGVEVTLPQRNLTERTNDSGAFNFNFHAEEAVARALVFRINLASKKTSFTLDLSAYPEIPVRVDFIYDEKNAEITFEGITPDPGIAIADELTRCSNGGKECGKKEFCFFSEGDCGVSQGVCRPTPEACTMLYAPVCGCNGVTYSNDCEAASMGVSVATLGECQQ